MRRRVLFVVLEMDLGGLQRMVSLLINRLDLTKFEPYLVCLDRSGPFYDEAASVCSASYILGRRPGVFDRHLFADLWRIVRAHKIEVIHSHNGCSSYAVLAGKLNGVQTIVHTDHGRLVPDKRSAMLEDRLSSCFLTKFVVVSSELAEYVVGQMGISRRKVATILNGVDDQKFLPANDSERTFRRRELGYSDSDRVIGTVCRLDPIKNLDFLISGMSSILKLLPDAKLLFVGVGPERERLERLANSVGVAQSVKFLGFRSDTENVYPAFDVYACSSLSEGTSMTILEAMACGLPVLASRVGGNVRLVDTRSGCLFDLDDPREFVEEVVRYLGDSVLRRRLGANARRRIELEFGLSTMVSAYETLYMTKA